MRHHRFNRYVTVPTLNTNYVVSLFVKRVTAGSVSNMNRYIELEVTGNFNGNSAGTGQSGSDAGSHVVYDLQDLTVHPGQSNNTRGFVGDAKLEAYPNDWYRLSYVFNPGSGSNSTGQVWWGHTNSNTGDSGNEQGNGNPSFYFWGASVENGKFPTSYIPTTGTTMTRGNESFEIDGEDFTDFFNTTEGTVLSHITPLDNSLGNHSGTGGVVWSFDAGGGFGNGNYFSNANSTTTFGHSVVIGGSGQSTAGGTGNQTNGVPLKNATVFKKDDFIMATNGTTASADTSGNLPTVVKLVLGNNGWGSALNTANIYFNRFSYYPKRLPDSQLVTLTS